MSKINNLKEFLAWRGFAEDEAYSWARCFYKYTPCGPWAVFIMRDQPARVDTWSVLVVRDQNGKLRAMPSPRNGRTDMPPLDIIRRFGFDEAGVPIKEDREYLTSLKTYRAALEAYRDRLDARDDLSFNVHAGPKDPKPGERQWLLIGITRPVGESFREIYYSDIGRKDDSGVEIAVDPEQCAGIKFGSIVEGSEVCFGPVEHLFPFDTEAFDRDVEAMEAETSYYWERDNSAWYRLTVRDRDYYLHENWGEVKWDGDKPSRALRLKVEAFVTEHYDDIPREPSVWAKPQPDWQPIRIPGTRADIRAWVNDLEF